ncbi:hypothetical protein AcW1_008344 [Taiwanofungus camphoratus]|nr:hypothetical protein AcW1_008344 [Antrodia cinnamomea]KAI0956150.1 hypothetical protein AcV7_006626 [Antrodia cinnamomea]
MDVLEFPRERDLFLPCQCSWYKSNILRNPEITLVLDHAGVRPQEPAGALVELRIGADIRGEEVVVEETAGNGLDEYRVVVPEEMQGRILGDADLAASHSLPVKRVQISLPAHHPQVSMDLIRVTDNSPSRDLLTSPVPFR